MTSPLPSAGSAFSLLFHRKANSRVGYRQAVEAWARLQQIPEFRANGWLFGVEGDVNWVPAASGGFRFFFWHPDRPSRVIQSESELDRLLRLKEAYALEEGLDTISREDRLVLEIKNGLGSREAALQALLKIVKDSLRQGFWIDSYNLSDLELVKRLDSAIPTSLHTSWAGVSGALLTPGFRNFFDALFRIRRAPWNRLDHVDLLTTFLRPTRAGSRRLVESCRRRGKSIVFGGIFTPSLFRSALASGASAGYIRFDPARLAGPEFAAAR